MTESQQSSPPETLPFTQEHLHAPADSTAPSSPELTPDSMPLLQVLEALLLRRIQQAGGRVAWEVLAKPFNGFPRPLNHCLSALGIAHHKLTQPLLQSGRIQLINGEDPYAALRASWSADEPIAAAASGVGQRPVQDLNELRVTSRKLNGFRVHIPILFTRHNCEGMIK